MIQQDPDLGRLPLRFVFGQYRYEGLGEGTLGKQATQEIRDTEGDKEGISAGAGTEQARHDDITQQAEDAGQ